MQLDDVIQKRKSVRKYLSKKPDWRDIIEAIDSARYAPMAGNIFTLNTILVSDEKLIDQIKDYCGQDFVGEAKYLVVFVSDKRLVEKSFGDDAKKYLRHQAGASMENFLLKLTELKLSTCWVGLFEEEHIKRLLKIPDAFQVEAIFPIGYDGENKPQKKKSTLEAMIHFNTFGNKKMKEIKQVEPLD